MKILTLGSLLFLLALAACMPTPVPSQTPSPEVESPTPPLVTPTAGVTYMPTRTPFTTAPLVTVPARDCEGAPRSQLILYERGYVTENGRSLNLRAGPGTSFRVVDRMEPGEIFLVIDGPVCGSAYFWFQVRQNDTIGWIAEGEPGVYYAEPYFPG